MGVPRFFRVILQRWPRILTYVSETPRRIVNGQEVPINLTEPNPNGIEFDNLYLDMNNMFILFPFFILIPSINLFTFVLAFIIVAIQKMRNHQKQKKI